MPRVSKIETFINPAGFVEQIYIGPHKAPAVLAAVKDLDKLSKELATQKRPVLILIDVTQAATKIDPETNLVAIRAMKAIKFKRGALYGPVVIQMLVNTLAMVAGKRNKICGFKSREDAIKWLRTGSS